ncbi:MAG: hypothetical protein NC320_01945 [Clostridium sp.]|nr:hypothetical protein [Clostridium sp.]
MNMRNLLKPGDFALLIPNGIQLTLQYNVSGNLEKVYTGFLSDRTDKTGELIEVLINNNVLPCKIHITKGTSWIRGVFYTDKQFSSSGVLPKAVECEMIKEFTKNPALFKFYAATIESTALSFRGSTPVRQCLSMAKFDILPGWLVPYNISEKTVKDWISTPQYIFSPIVTDYIVFHDDVVYVLSTGLKQCKIESVENYVDYNGYLKSKINVMSPQKTVYTDYSDVVRMNIRKNSVVIFDNEDEIVSCRNESRTRSYSKTITCPYCGKVYNVPDSGYTACPDIHCPSKLLRNIKQFISILKLPEYDNNVISAWLKNHDVTCIPDLLLLDEYKDIKIEISISDLLRALVPTSIIPDEDVFITFAVACSNTESTFRYYIENSDKISADLGVQHKDLDKLVMWLSDNCNISDIITVMGSPQISLTTSKKKFEGAPVFRNKTIYLTGTFIRGSVGEIASILQSYSASVTTQFSNIVDCVIVGGTRENIDGKSIRSAQTLNKPIIDEDDFFTQYEIDEDLRNNLV